MDNFLPTIAEIRASTEVLSSSDASATVVKVQDGLAVKYGPGVTSLEADNLRYLSAHVGCLVPKLLAVLKEPETGIVFIVMEYIEGESLANALPLLTSSEKNQ
jgi:hypothetical protein